MTSKAKGMKRSQERTRKCAHCGEEFVATQEFSSYKRKFCSVQCSSQAAHERTIAAYPPKDDVERLYVTEELSDVELGKHYGRSYQWAFKLRRYYEIPGRPQARKRKPLKQKGDRARWGIHLKAELWCRNCGAAGELHLHHVVPRSMSKAAKYDLRNGLPLCVRCHLGWHQRTSPIYRDVFTAEEWDFLRNLELIGQEIGPWLDERYPEPTGEPFVAHCQRGHPFDEANTIHAADGKRRCRACANERARRYRALSRAHPEAA